MAEKEKWYHCDGKGNVKEIAVEPNTYIQGYSFMYSDNQRIAGMTPIFLYMRLTGAYSITDFQKVIKNGELNPAQKAVKENISLAPLLLDLFDLFQHESYDKLYKSVKAGKFNPALTEILERQPAVEYNALNDLLDARNFSEIVLQAVKNGKLDFTKFNDTDDPAPDWFLKYRLSPVPVPGLFGRVSSLGLLAPGFKETVFESHKGETVRTLKKHITEALQIGTEPETLLLLADEIKKRYAILKKAGEKNYNNSAFPFNSELSAGFVVDIPMRKIFDLRPHYNELREALAPGVEPLKEFYQLIKTAVREYKDKTFVPEVYGSYVSLERDIPLVPIKTTPEMMAFYTLTGKIEMYEQQELAILGEHGNDPDEDARRYRYSKEVATKKGSVAFNITGVKKGTVIDPGLQKLDILVKFLSTKTPSRSFAFNVEEYMEACNVKITKESRKEFKKKLWNRLAFFRDNWTFTVKRDGNVQVHTVISGYGKDKGGRHYSVTLSPEYCAYVQNSHDRAILWVTDYIFKSDERNPHIIPFLMALSRHRQIKNNIKSGTANTMSLRALIESDEELLYKLKRKGIGGHYGRYIIEPTFKTLARLVQDGVITVKFVDRDGNEHTPDETQFVTITDFLDSDKWRLNYEFNILQERPEILKKFERKHPELGTAEPTTEQQ